MAFRLAFYIGYPLAFSLRLSYLQWFSWPYPSALSATRSYMKIYPNCIDAFFRNQSGTRTTLRLVKVTDKHLWNKIFSLLCPKGVNTYEEDFFSFWIAKSLIQSIIYPHSINQVWTGKRSRKTSGRNLSLAHSSQLVAQLLWRDLPHFWGF